MRTQNLVRKFNTNQQASSYFGTVLGISIYACDFLTESLKEQQLKYVFAFIPTLIILVCSWYFVLIKKPQKLYLKLFFSDPINLLCSASLIFGILWNLIYRSDISAVLQTGVFWGSVLSYKLFTEKFPVSRYTFFWVLLLLIIPYAFTSNDPEVLKFLIPSAENQWKAFLITTHFSSVLGSIILVFGLYGILKRESLSINFSMFAAGLYLVVFAKSRTSLLATLIPLLLGVFFTKKRQLALFLTTLLVVGSIYIIVPVIQENPNSVSRFANTSFLRSFIKLDDTEAVQGISSGRQWLWGYHIDLFKQNILTGASRQLTAFEVGDKIEKGRALAGSESFLTYVLARYGVWGISYYIFFLLLLWKAIKSKNKEFYILMVYSIISCIGISLLGNTYGAHNIVIYLYIFTLLNASKKGVRPSHNKSPTSYSQSL